MRGSDLIHALDLARHFFLKGLDVRIDHQAREVRAFRLRLPGELLLRLAVVRIVVNAVEPSGVEGAGATDEAVYFITFAQQKFGEIGTVLSGDAGDECFFAHIK